ncbi:S8 family serine peptidase [Leptodesmis sichuanensis]|uniref:S8 family serine peptidase n=1 Tax=Leptodesmis sichuanensis TaxID=2906798 RepID=UPI001F15B78C|nr:S8 family serine peptidase [Leptodesmis sichuanensis]UIE38106.1 S8 family serine peptidase [Leptodesmis sichuanensis A121]
MTSSINQELPPKIYSEAVVRPINGSSLLSFTEPITSENVNQFYVNPQRMSLVAKQLQAQGFEVLDQGRISITIRGSPELYEQVFKARLTTEQRPVIKAFGCQTTGTFISAVDTDRFGFVDPSQSLFADVLDGVAINEPIYYFDANTPTTDPPCPSYWHLTVPEGVARGLNADQAHQTGFTGHGIKVAMVDTGWYNHPFFEKQGYHAKVVLGPGVDDFEDNEGHGTGESANLFAVAPGIEFTMVKADVQIRERSGNVNSIAALKKAISLKPDIISCSWGTNCTEKPLSAYEQILGATVADAIHQGIIVIFAAGNGHCGFPAQHPEVIAAGGVYMDRDGLLEASDYASGFVSPIYPQRFVPDVCGLVGKPPRAAYIMLPVPPGSLSDQELGQAGVNYPDGDETASDDGWAAFSGTSAAAPQLAGVCALMKQANPDLSPSQAKEILQQTARDVCRGCCNRYTGSKGAGVGFDLATGYGLVDAYQVVMKAQSEAKIQGQCRKQPEVQLFQWSRTIPREEVMDATLRTRHWFR